MSMARPTGFVLASLAALLAGQSASAQSASPMDICLRTWTEPQCWLRALLGQSPFDNPGRPLAGPLFVSFGFNAAELSPEARENLAGLRDVYSRIGSEAPTLTIIGHADRSGSAEYNLELSRRRAEAVRDYFIAGGVLPELLVVQADGESRPAVETSDGVREPDNRRVDLAIGPSSQR